MTLRRLVLLACALPGLGCGGGTSDIGVFSPVWTDDDGRSIGRLEAKLAGTPIPLGADVAVATAAASSRVIGRPLDGGPKWTFDHALDARPVIAGGVVVGSGGGELFALDARSGKLLWKRATGGLLLRGAGDDGHMTVATLTGSDGRGSTLLAVGRDGSVLRQLEPSTSLGSPAVVHGYAFVPWDNQYVSVLDVDSGAEAARLLLREKTTRARVVGGALFFGELGLFRFDGEIAKASQGHADHVALPYKNLPGQPMWMRPGDEATAPAAGASDSVRLYARPTASGPLTLDSDRFYATYFRLVFGFNEAARLSWVRTRQADVLGGAAAHGALVLCDGDGKLFALDARTGADLSPLPDLGEPVQSCVVQDDGFAPTGTPVARPLGDEIRAALQSRDLELTSGQTLLVRSLAELPDQVSTDILLEVATDGRLAPNLLAEVRSALALRKAGAPELIAALGRHYDFLHDVKSLPPVGPIARALATMKSKDAAPALAAWLLDPAIPEEDLREVARALDALAGPAELPALSEFVTLYADAPPVPEEIPESVGDVADAMMRLGGPPAAATLRALVARPGTNGVVKAKLQALLDAAAAASQPPTKTP